MKELKVGRTYTTKGGWDALIIWKSANTGYYVIHKPGAHDESVPLWHQGSGKVSDCAFGVNLAPCYEGHPADIVEEKSGK